MNTRSRTRKPNSAASSLCLLLTVVLTSSVHGETGSKPAEDPVALTREAVELISRLHELEQQLLYPAHTRVSVFLSVAEQSEASPHSISVAIDNHRVTHHIYTAEEISALNAGGIQRLYTGNTLTGQHELRVSFRQSGTDGRVDTHDLVFQFDKREDAENIEITVDQDKPYIAIRSRN